MRLKSFLQAIDPEIYVKVEHVDGTQVAFNQAEGIIKHNDRRLDVVGAYPEQFTGPDGRPWRLGLVVLVQEIERS